MKRIFVLCMACMVLFAGTASAKILKGKDSFTGYIYASSWQYPKPILDVLNFHKDIKNNGIGVYKLSVSQVTSKRFALENLPIEIKIDEYDVQELTDYRYRLTGPDSYGVEYNSVIDFMFPENLIQKIKDAKRVAIRIKHMDGTEIPYVLPDNVLDEWKQVINTTE